MNDRPTFTQIVTNRTTVVIGHDFSDGPVSVIVICGHDILQANTVFRETSFITPSVLIVCPFARVLSVRS